MVEIRLPNVLVSKVKFAFSTASASYSALAAVFIEDVVKQFQTKVQKREAMKPNTSLLLARYLRLSLCCLIHFFQT